MTEKSWNLHTHSAEKREILSQRKKNFVKSTLVKMLLSWNCCHKSESEFQYFVFQTARHTSELKYAYIDRLTT